MRNNLEEEHYKAFLPLIEQNFPEGRRDFSTIDKLMKSFQQMSFYENHIIGLIDHKRHQAIYVSDNFEEITGISKKTFFSWKSMYMFRLLAPSHYSYPYRTLTKGLHFFNKVPFQERLYCKRFAAGMKIYDGQGKIRRIFSKSKVLSLDQEEKLDVSIFFIQDITHLVKGDVYWLRHAAPSYKNCYIKQKGKQHFDDLLTSREKEIVYLLAEHHTSNEIAEHLYLSPATVEKHKKNMLKRTGAVNSIALVHLCKLAEVITGLGV